MNRKSRGPAWTERGRAAVAASALALVLMLGSGGTWATAADAASEEDAPQPTSSAQTLKVAASEAPPSPTPSEDVADVAVTPTEKTQTANNNGNEVVEVPTPVAPKPVPADAGTDAPTQEAVKPQGDAPQAPTEVAEEEALADDEDGGITTLAVEDGALVWTVKDINTLVGGAKIRVQGPAVQGRFAITPTWTANNLVVEDCVAETCNGLDKDPAPGKFRVTNLGTHNISSDQRYRVQQETAPTAPPVNYRFLNPNAWIEIPGSRANPTPNPWTNDEWDFANFPVRKQGDFALACAPSYVYGLSADGQIRQVAPGTSAATDFASKAPDVARFNGLGIGLNGATAFAYERSLSTKTAYIWSFDTSTGKWSDTKKLVNTASIDTPSVLFVAGAVDLSTGKYYFGGFTEDGKQFRIWEYDPVSNSTKYKGYINTTVGSGGDNNGDMAFDSSGNLFVVRSGTATTVFSVTGANFQGATGGIITSAGSQSVTTMGNVNGVAFDSSGKAYLGSEGELRSYDMPSWTNSRTIVSTGLNSTDLATCSSPATVTLEKDIPGGRFKASDQFKLELKQGSQTLGTATTTGSASGIQEQRVGPLPVAPNSTLTFNESFVPGTTAADYATSYSCTADGSPLNSGPGTSGSVTVPPGADQVVCQITNQLLVANVNIHKEIADIKGVKSDGAGWTVGAGVTATSGTATSTPAAATQVTNTTGDASWTVRFNSKTGKANVVVSEKMQSGYEFVEGTCLVESFNGTSSETLITSTNYGGLTLGNIGPGDTVNCEFVNKQLPATVQVDKKWTINDEAIAHVDRPEGLTADLTLTPNPGAQPAWGEPRGPFAINDKVKISESASVNTALLPGCSLGVPVISGPGISGTVELGLGTTMEVILANATNEYTITNPVTCVQKLTLTKTVVSDFDGQRLPANWQLLPSAWNGGLSAQMDGATPLTFNSGEQKDVSDGQYVLSEVDKDNYLFQSLICDGVVLDATRTVDVGLGQSVSCTFTNKDAPGSVTWTKVDETGVLLSGSEWKLEGPGGVVAPILDCIDIPCTGFDKDPAAGEFKLEGLAWGDYSLVETKAPAGFVINSTPHVFTISPENLVEGFAEGFVNEQREGLVIPMTGGLGSYQFWIAASLLGALAGGGLLWQRRNRIKAVKVSAS